MLELRKYPHTELTIEYNRQIDEGELGRTDGKDWWQWFSKPITAKDIVFAPVNILKFHWNNTYKFEKTKHHPDNINKNAAGYMASLPKGTMTNHGEILKYYSMKEGNRTTNCASLYSEKGVTTMPISVLRIVENPTFTYWGGGDTPPVPDEMFVEIIRRNKCKEEGKACSFNWKYTETEMLDIIAYRILWDWTKATYHTAT